MNRKPITVRMFGDPSAIVQALDEARVACVKKALEGYTPDEQNRILEKIYVRYKPR